MEQSIQEIKNLILEAKRLVKDPKNRQELKFIAEDLVCAQAEFIEHKTKAEQDYRIEIEKVRVEKELSFAAAENLVKTTEVYRIYRMADSLYDLATDQIRVLKTWFSSGY